MGGGRKRLGPWSVLAPQWTVASPEDQVVLEGGGRTSVHRRGNVVIRDTGSWTPAVALWAMAWRARSAAWMIRHRGALEAALTK
jgi:hypothetical protein